MNRFLSILILFFPFYLTGQSFDPADIPGLELRYDINVLATNDETVITTLIDSSGNGYNAIADGSGLFWTNNLYELNNMGYLMFRNATYYVAANPTLSQPNTVFMVARVQLPPGGNEYCLMGGGNQIAQYSPASIGMNAGNDCASCPITGTNWVIYEFQFNGASPLLGTNGTVAWSGCNVGSASQGETIVGAGNGDWNPGMFDLAYLLFYNAALTAVQSSNVVVWLNNKLHVFGYGPLPPAGPPWYASPTGKNNGDADGSITNPWNIVTAFHMTNAIQPGDTLYLRGGTYTNHAVHANLLLVGTSNSPITIRPYGSEKVIITVAGGATNQGGDNVDFNGSYCTLRDVEITNSETNRWAINSTVGTYAVAVGIYGDHNKMINCIIHDNGEGVWIGAAATNTEVYGCWIFNNGSQNLSTTNLDGSARSPDSQGQGHGFYARSPIPTTLLAENLVFNGFGLGIQCYSTSSAIPINGFRLEGNVVFGNGRLQAGGDGEPNVYVAGGGLVDNLLVYTNFFFALGYSVSDNARFGSGAGVGDTRVGEGSAAIVGNHFMGASYNYVNTFTNLVFTNNYIVGTESNNGYSIMWLNFYNPGATNLPSDSAYSWNYNFYNDHNLGYPWPFKLSTNTATKFSFVDWTNFSGFDINSSYSTAAQTNVEVYVRPNKYDTNRANIIVINWPTNNTVSVNLSGFLRVGQRYQILNGQDPLSGPILTGTYSNAVALPMTNLSAAAPIGAKAPPAVSPFFNVFILQRQPSAPTNLRIVR